MRLFKYLLALIYILSLSSCGGGGSSSDPQETSTDVVWDTSNWDEQNWK